MQIQVARVHFQHENEGYCTQIVKDCCLTSCMQKLVREGRQSCLCCALSTQGGPQTRMKGMDPVWRHLLPNGIVYAPLMTWSGLLSALWRDQRSTLHTTGPGFSVSLLQQIDSPGFLSSLSKHTFGSLPTMCCAFVFKCRPFHSFFLLIFWETVGVGLKVDQDLSMLPQPVNLIATFETTSSGKCGAVSPEKLNKFTLSETGHYPHILFIFSS